MTPTQHARDIPRLQLRLSPLTPNQRPPIREHRLPTLDLDHKPNFLETVLIRVSRPPHLGNQLISRLDWRSKPGLELLEVLRLRRTEGFQDGVRRHVPREEAVNDGSAKTHLLARFGVGVERVVVAV
jgi:hypothetical protein